MGSHMPCDVLAGFHLAQVLKSMAARGGLSQDFSGKVFEHRIPPHSARDEFRRLKHRRQPLRRTADLY